MHLRCCKKFFQQKISLNYTAIVTSFSPTKSTKQALMFPIFYSLVALQKSCYNSLLLLSHGLGQHRANIIVLHFVFVSSAILFLQKNIFWKSKAKQKCFAVNYFFQLNYNAKSLCFEYKNFQKFGKLNGIFRHVSVLLSFSNNNCHIFYFFFGSLFNLKSLSGDLKISLFSTKY